MIAVRTHLDERVLVLAPTARDAEVTTTLLSGAGITCEIVPSLSDLANAIGEGVGAVLLTDDALALPQAEVLIRAVERQPEWSDLPVVVLVRAGEPTDVVKQAVALLSNVVLIERPAAVRTMISTVRAAVRARRRQYQIRDQIEQIRSLLESERIARNEAECASRAKDEFVATLSHELRTPMAAVLGWVHILRRAPADAKTAEHGLEVIERNARAQSKLIEDLLEMSRILSGKVRLNVHQIDVRHVVDAAVDSVRHAMEAKQIVFNQLIEPNVGQIHADAERLQQVLWNLLSNAAKFTPTGGSIDLNVSRIKDSVRIVVRDDGLGMDPAFVPHVFERFRQAESPTTRRAGGLGLGLGIVKHLVELHGGTVSAHSEGAGKGAEFTIELPIGPPRSSASDADRDRAAPGHRTHDLSGLRVLLIDDDADMRELAKHMLARWNAKVITAGSAQEGLAEIQRDQPDVVVCDVGMPEMDGYEFIRRLRQSHPADRVPAAALTAFAGDHHRQRALAAGFQAHLPKPVDDCELAAVVVQLAGRGRCNGHTAPPKP